MPRSSQASRSQVAGRTHASLSVEPLEHLRAIATLVVMTRCSAAGSYTSTDSTSSCTSKQLHILLRTSRLRFRLRNRCRPTIPYEACFCTVDGPGRGMFQRDAWDAMKIRQGRGWVGDSYNREVGRTAFTHGHGRATVET